VARLARVDQGREAFLIAILTLKVTQRIKANLVGIVNSVKATIEQCSHHIQLAALCS